MILIVQFNDRAGFCLQAGEPGVVVLRAAAGAAQDSGSESEGEVERPPSPCSVRFVNDNVLINGRSSMRPDRQRIAKVKLSHGELYKSKSQRHMIYYLRVVPLAQVAACSAAVAGTRR